MGRFSASPGRLGSKQRTQNAPQPLFSLKVFSRPVLPSLFHFRATREDALCGAHWKDFPSLRRLVTGEGTGPGTLAAQAPSCPLGSEGVLSLVPRQESLARSRGGSYKEKTCDRHCCFPPLSLQTEPKFYSEKQGTWLKTAFPSLPFC